MSKRKFFEDRMTKLDGLMNEAKAKINPDGNSVPTISMDEYVDQYRTRINMLLIELCSGAEFKASKKGGWKLEFKHKMMTPFENAALTSKLDTFISKVEIRAVQQWVSTAKATPADDDDDMSIPVQAPVMGRIEKINRKNFTAAVIGDSTKAGYSRMYLTAADLASIVANAYELRRKEQRNMALIIGGILIVIAAGVAVATVVHNKKAKEVAADISAELDDIPSDVDLDAVPEDVDLDDMPPHVNLDE